MRDYSAGSKQSKAYSNEHVEEFLRLTAGGAPLTTIEIDEETYDYITLLADHWNMTRRQAFTKIMKTATDKVLNEQPCTCDWIACDRPACQEEALIDYEFEAAKDLRIVEENYYEDHLELFPDQEYLNYCHGLDELED